MILWRAWSFGDVTQCSLVNTSSKLDDVRYRLPDLNSVWYLFSTLHSVRYLSIKLHGVRYLSTRLHCVRYLSTRLHGVRYLSTRRHGFRYLYTRLHTITFQKIGVLIFTAMNNSYLILRVDSGSDKVVLVLVMYEVSILKPCLGPQKYLYAIPPPPAICVNGLVLN
jgi:hypothetical protein